MLFIGVHSCSFVVIRVHRCSFVVIRVHSRSFVFTRVHSCGVLDQTPVSILCCNGVCYEINKEIKRHNKEIFKNEISFQNILKTWLIGDLRHKND